MGHFARFLEIHLDLESRVDVISLDKLKETIRSVSWVEKRCLKINLAGEGKRYRKTAKELRQYLASFQRNEIM